MKTLSASGFNSPLEYVGTGECKDCFDWETSAGKAREKEEWLSPGKQTDFCFRGEREDCLTAVLSGSGWRRNKNAKEGTEVAVFRNWKNTRMGVGSRCSDPSVHLVEKG